MKTSFAKTWISSIQTRKQRKYRYNAPLHIKSKFLNTHLDASLRKKYNVRALRVRKGDTVKVVAGQFKGKTGKVEKVDAQYVKVFVAGIENHRKDGSKSLIPLQPSNLMIIDLDLSDNKRVLKLKTDVKKAETKKVVKSGTKVKAEKTEKAVKATKEEVKNE